VTPPNRVVLLAASHELDQWADVLEQRREDGRATAVRRLANRVRGLAVRIPPNAGGASDIDARQDRGQ
jgi:hypothetical protein